VSKKEDKKPKKAKGAAAEAPEEAAPKPKKQKAGPSEPSRMKVHYSKDVEPALMKHFKYTNVMAVPKLEKIVINMGLGEAIANAKIIDIAADELGRISGQRPVVTKAKKSIANFKLRQNMASVCSQLRGEKMFEFLDRLSASFCLAFATSAASPRLRRTWIRVTRSVDLSEIPYERSTRSAA
jgi:large subunit ribosomal protein L5